jgi:hypothetical protein
MGLFALIRALEVWEMVNGVRTWSFALGPRHTVQRSEISIRGAFGLPHTVFHHLPTNYINAPFDRDLHSSFTQTDPKGKCFVDLLHLITSQYRTPAKKLGLRQRDQLL